VVAVSRVVALVDDLDGGPAAETVHFALDGAGYELDLSAANAAALRAALARYVTAARRTTTPALTRQRPAAPARRANQTAVGAIRAAATQPTPAPTPAAEPDTIPQTPPADRTDRPTPINPTFSDQPPPTPARP
jgi:hypothetical protein